LQTAIGELKKNIGGWYSSAEKALNQTYHAKFTTAYQCTRTDEALVDADFAANEQGVALLQKILSGDLTPVFSATPGLVVVHSGTLTHSVQRHTHIELALPYFDQTWEHINAAVATVHTDDGKLLVYKLDAQDETEVQRQARFRRDSQLSLSGVWKQVSAPDLNVHADAGNVSYVLHT
jgi:hypothetical protein